MMMVLTEQTVAETSNEATFERRRGLRIGQQRPVKVYEPSSARFVGGQTFDISATGLRIELPVSAPVQVGKVVSIHVGLNQTGESLANRRSMIPARIVWIDRSKGSARMTAGVEFLAAIAAHREAA